ncbi:MAG: hypothetical protein V3V49_08045 [Candidatus Krumholzibacteria bacterium]
MSARKFCSDESGLGLLIVMIMVGVLSGLAFMGLSLAHSELEIAVRNESRTAASYAAEAGLALSLENWAGAMAATTPPGDTTVISQGTLAGGFSYRGVVQRLDDGSSVHPLYALRVGATRAGYRGQVGLLVTSVPLEIPMDFAMRVRSTLTMRGSSVIDGNDNVPPNLAADCPPPDDSRPGIITDDVNNLDVDGGPTVDGDPPVLVDPDITDENFFDFGGLSFEEIAAKANIVFNGNSTISGTDPKPSLDGNGYCDVSDQFNWGDPTNLGEPCSSWFPIIYVNGDLQLNGSGAGQGILIVNGDLNMTSGVEFYGPVIVTGQLTSTGGGFHIYGGLITGATDINDESVITGNSTVAFSSCALRRAVSHSDVSEARVLAERPWFQTR